MLVYNPRGTIRLTCYRPLENPPAFSAFCSTGAAHCENLARELAASQVAKARARVAALQLLETDEIIAGAHAMVDRAGILQIQNHFDLSAGRPWADVATAVASLRIAFFLDPSGEHNGAYAHLDAPFIGAEPSPEAIAGFAEIGFHDSHRKLTPIHRGDRRAGSLAPVQAMANVQVLKADERSLIKCFQRILVFSEGRP